MQKKNVTNNTRIALELYNIGIFAVVWVLFYNNYTFDTHHKMGGTFTVLLYAFVYNSLCQLYKAFRIASFQITETTFSQMISIGIADLIFYVECCLVYNRYVNIFYGAAAFLLQVTGSLFIIVTAKRYFIKNVPPKSTILIYGNKIKEWEIESFKVRLLKKYDHLFSIDIVLSERMPKNQLIKNVDEADTVLLYEMENENRIMLMKYCIGKKKSVYLTPDIGDILIQGCSVKHLLDTPLIKYDYSYEKASGDFLKRIMDIVVSAIILLLAAPVMLFTAIAIKLEDGGPVFYKQKRCTKNGRVFHILKFRSMIVDAEKEGFKPCINGDVRITKVGKVIRATRCDELPQLFNILSGSMSIVGPRPERVEHVKKYTEEIPEFAYRLRVKGGLTGYAQIYGRYNTSAYDKLRLDLMYIENRSFILDLKIVLLTIKVIFTRESTEGFSNEKSSQFLKEYERINKSDDREKKVI